MTPLVEIAKALQEKGVKMPESMLVGDFTIQWLDTHGHRTELHEDVARSVLIAAMVMECNPCRYQDQWWIRPDSTRNAGFLSVPKWFKDASHGNDPLQSLFAAWEWAKGTT